MVVFLFAASSSTPSGSTEVEGRRDVRGVFVNSIPFSWFVESVARFIQINVVSHV